MTDQAAAVQALLAPDPSVLHMSAKYPTDPIYTPR